MVTKGRLGVRWAFFFFKSGAFDKGAFDRFLCENYIALPGFAFISPVGAVDNRGEPNPPPGYPEAPGYPRGTSAEVPLGYFSANPPLPDPPPGYL